MLFFSLFGIAGTVLLGGGIGWAEFSPDNELGSTTRLSVKKEEDCINERATEF